MRIAWAGLRTPVVLLCAVVAAGAPTVALAGPASGQVVPSTLVEQPFAADSGDSCRYGLVEGVLGWRLDPLGGPPTVVEVTGTIRDRPVPIHPTEECGNDGRYSTATLTAYARSGVVDTETVRVNNGAREFAFRLTGTSGAVPIARVIVEVCRPPLVGTRPVYCGPRQEYRAPVS
jgi:hypothetical protein